MRRSTLLTLAAVLTLSAAPAWAQSVSQTGTGGGPASAAKAPHTTATGQTVPNPGALNPSETGSIERRDATEERNDAITRGICIGCSR